MQNDTLSIEIAAAAAQDAFSARRAAEEKRFATQMGWTLPGDYNWRLVNDAMDRSMAKWPEFKAMNAAMQSLRVHNRSIRAAAKIGGGA